MTYSRGIGRRLRRTATLLAACSFALQSLGVCLPAGYQITDQSPFPCQGHRCGCRTAEQCWQTCCCFTAQQRLAWAETHGITAPEYLIASASSATATQHDDDYDHAPQEHSRSCCKTNDQPPSAHACSTHHHACSHCPSEEPSNSIAENTESKLHWISFIAAQRCQGAWQNWLQVPVCLPLTKLAPRTVREPAIQTLCQSPADLFLSPSFEPLLPPPRCS